MFGQIRMLVNESTPLTYRFYRLLTVPIHHIVMCLMLLLEM